jgi:Toxin SymE, type I toxin-antitoxin system
MYFRPVLFYRYIMLKSFQRTDPDPPARTLKIEAEGDFWKGLTKPKIRLMGRWLERAGFSPGNRVQVTCVAPGVIELRSPDAVIVNDTKPPTPGQTGCSI